MERSHIDETRLVTRRSARDQIHLAWDYRCAYCGDGLGRTPTLDHVVARSRGGEHHRGNMVSCCLVCNSRKGDADWREWFRRQPFWTLGRERAIQQWIQAGHGEPPYRRATPRALDGMA